MKNLFISAVLTVSISNAFATEALSTSAAAAAAAAVGMGYSSNAVTNTSNSGSNQLSQTNSGNNSTATQTNSGNSTVSTTQTNSGNNTTATLTNTGNNSTNASTGNATTVLGDTYQAPRIPVASAWAAPLTASNGTCMGSSSGGAQGAGFGFSIGSTWTDLGCDRRYNAQMLNQLGATKAAIALMCQDNTVKQAMQAAGTPCP